MSEHHHLHEGLNPEARAFGRIRRSIVEIRVSHQFHDPDRPWAKRYPATRFAQAAIVEGHLLLTTAQMVSGATLIEVEKEGTPLRAIARVRHQDRDLNLALLTVDDPRFFEDLHPLPLANATPTSGTVYTVRWRAQQFEAAATRIKRVIVGEVYFGRLRHAFLLGQTDLSDGGWAEPVIAHDALVGIASSQDEHTAWIVPSEVLSAYLASVRERDSQRSFAVLRFSWDWNLDPSLSAYLGQQGEQRGIIVRSVPYGSTGHGVLKPRDLLLELDGHPIDACGYYQHPRFGRIEFTHIAVDGHRAGDILPAKILRAGALLEVEIQLAGYPTAIDLIPLRRGDDPPAYAIAGGLVFIELDGDYLRAWGKEWWNTAPTRLVSMYVVEEGTQRPDRRRLVLLSQVLPSAFTIGYEDCRDLAVKSINGRAIDSIEDVVEAFGSPEGDFHRVIFYPNPLRSDVVLDAAALEPSTEQILADYDIPASHRLAVVPPPPL